MLLGVDLHQLRYLEWIGPCTRLAITMHRVVLPYDSITWLLSFDLCCFGTGNGETWGVAGKLPKPGQLCFESLQVARYWDGQYFMAHEVTVTLSWLSGIACWEGIIEDGLWRFGHNDSSGCPVAGRPDTLRLVAGCLPAACGPGEQVSEDCDASALPQRCSRGANSTNLDTICWCLHWAPSTCTRSVWM